MDTTLAMSKLTLKDEAQSVDDSNSQTSSDNSSTTTCNHSNTDSSSSAETQSDSPATAEVSTSPPVPNPARVALERKVKNVVDLLKVVDKEVYKCMTPDLHEQLDLGRVELLYNSICKKIKNQESVRPDPHGRPVITRDIPVPHTTVVDTPDLVADMLRVMDAHINIVDASSYDPALSIDTEGPLYLLQVMVIKPHLAYFIDFPKLGSLAFTTSITTAQGELTLKTFFEAKKVLKLLWDCRGDGAKIRDIAGVSLDCVYDVQLMDIATRFPHERTKVTGLNQAVAQRLSREVPDAVLKDFLVNKDFGRLAWEMGFDKAQALYKQTKGDYPWAVRILTAIEDPMREKGSKEVFKRDFPEPYLIRPIPDLLFKYALNDVRFLPAMYDHFINNRYWNDQWAKIVWDATEERLHDESEGGHDGPAGWDQLPHVDKTVRC